MSLKINSFCSDNLKPIAAEERRIEEEEKKVREEQERIAKQLAEGTYSRVTHSPPCACIRLHAAQLTGGGHNNYNTSVQYNTAVSIFF